MVCGVSCSWTSEKIFYLHVLENYPKYFYDMLARRWAIVALWATCYFSIFLIIIIRICQLIIINDSCPIIGLLDETDRCSWQKLTWILTKILLKCTITPTFSLNGLHYQKHYYFVVVEKLLPFVCFGWCFTSTINSWCHVGMVNYPYKRVSGPASQMWFTNT